MLVTVALDTGSGRVGLIAVFTVRALLSRLTLRSFPEITDISSHYAATLGLERLVPSMYQPIAHVVGASTDCDTQTAGTDESDDLTEHYNCTAACRFAVFCSIRRNSETSARVFAC
jgi:hypothetical protein